MTGWQALGGLMLAGLAVAGLSVVVRDMGWGEMVKMVAFVATVTGIVVLAAFLIAGEIP